MIQIVTGTAEVGGGLPRSREREVARLTPALYALFPEAFGYRELRDRFIASQLTNLHVIVPSMNRVIKLSVAFLSAEP